MTLARRLGLHDLPGYVPVAFVLTAFAIGAQAALLLQSFPGSGYPPPGQSVLAWTSLIIILASLALNTPLDPIKRGSKTLKSTLSRPFQRRSVMLEPHPDQPLRGGVVDGTNGEETMPRLSARIHSPLAAGPVIAPGETLPVTVEAEPESLGYELTVTFEVHGPARTHRFKRGMEGTRIVEGLVFEESGGFEVHVGLSHPDAENVGQTLAGRVASYREETARLFESLKERLAKAGLDVGPQSTPREVCQELQRANAADASTLAELAVELEIALYGDEEIQRSTYEAIFTTLQTVQAPSREGVA